jgi:hypothetical protein
LACVADGSVWHSGLFPASDLKSELDFLQFKI